MFICFFIFYFFFFIYFLFFFFLFFIYFLFIFYLFFIIYNIYRWFESDNKNTVAIYDATNITKERRKNVLNLLTPEDIDVIFIEIICNDSEIIKNNISDIRVSSPDYKGMNPDKAEEDFNLRIAHYEKVYEPLDLEEEEKLSFIKSINIRTRVIVNRVDGYIQTRIVYFLMNLHAAPRYITYNSFIIIFCILIIVYFKLFYNYIII